MTQDKKYIENAKVRSDILNVLKNDGIVVIPTDTLYGLSAALSSEKAYNRIVKLKQCGEDRNFLLLADSVDMIENYIHSWGSTSKEELEGIWPAALTAILPAGRKCPKWAGKSIAFRIPVFDPLLNLLEELDEPIISTSVNLKGEPPLHTAEEIEKLFGKKLDFIAVSKQERQDLPSTIVDFTLSEPHVVRQGTYLW